MDLVRLRQDITDCIGSIKEPDHPTQTLEELGIVTEEDIHLTQLHKRVDVKIVWAPACQTAKIGCLEITLSFSVVVVLSVRHSAGASSCP